jgi:formyltetrahydrofolate-dependent phosphoribosylglycinamide formyltransferase
MPNLKKIIVLISGSGTNLQAILDAVQSGYLKAELSLVVSNRRAAYGLERAEQAAVPTLYFPLKPYRDAGKSREQYDADLARILFKHQPDLIVLAGWMHVFTPAFLTQFAGKIINLHPALPNTFAGTDSIERAFKAFQRGEITHSGCMVHHVIPEVDAGPIVDKVNVPIYSDDTMDTFTARMHEAEHRLLVDAIRQMLSVS